MLKGKGNQMEKPKQSLDEWFAKADALLAEIDAQNAPQALVTENVGKFLLQLDSIEPVAA